MEQSGHELDLLTQAHKILLEEKLRLEELSTRFDD
jgi:hypothetical protein